jgi:hypothetical protein
MGFEAPAEHGLEYLPIAALAANEAAAIIAQQPVRNSRLALSKTSIEGEQDAARLEAPACDAQQFQHLAMMMQKAIHHDHVGWPELGGQALVERSAMEGRCRAETSAGILDIGPVDVDTSYRTPGGRRLARKPGPQPTSMT